MRRRPDPTTRRRATLLESLPVLAHEIELLEVELFAKRARRNRTILELRALDNAPSGPQIATVAGVTQSFVVKLEAAARTG